MGLEATTSIAGLNSAWPLGGDEVSRGDDHLRLLKQVLKQTFPGAAADGFAIPIVATEAELNHLAGVASGVQSQLDLKSPLESPTFTGTPVAPTATANTNTTQLATTAFVLGQAASASPLALAVSAAIGSSLKYAREDHVHPLTGISAGGLTGLTILSTVGAGTYNVPASVKTGILVFLTGGGGSGAFGTTNYKGGGGAGTTALKYIPFASLASSYSYSVGAGGSAISGVNGSGISGDSTSFGSFTAFGGGFGPWSTDPIRGGTGGDLSAGSPDLTMRGGAGHAVTSAPIGSNGGDSFFGRGGYGGSVADSIVGQAGTYGGGGGGSDFTSSGAGGDGIILILEF